MASSVPPLARILSAYSIRRVELAARAGVDLKTVSRLCRGDCKGLKVETLCRVAAALGVEPADLAPDLRARQRGGGLLSEHTRGTRRQ
jgi:DNA-binding Xre family transcriptional regulator